MPDKFGFPTLGDVIDCMPNNPFAHGLVLGLILGVEIAIALGIIFSTVTRNNACSEPLRRFEYVVPVRPVACWFIDIPKAG